MCTVCGCSEGEARVAGSAVHEHEHAHGHLHEHPHEHAHHHGHAHEHQHTHHHQPDQIHEHRHDHSHKHDVHYGKGPARAHAPGLTQSRMVQIEQDILGKNQQYANANRVRFENQGVFALNLVSSPGSGKTSLLTRTLTELSGQMPMSVIEGDQETSQDADRIRATGAPAIQINTGKGCHLDGHMVGHALDTLKPQHGSVLFIENVGNLVCPAAFDLGEAHKVAILSVTEGEDKPIKYPDMFYASDLLLLNKVDLLPYLDFDIEKCIAFAKQVNPKIRVLQVSAKTGEGMQDWYQWLALNKQLRMLGQISPALEPAAAEIQVG